jgi:hypothetical protein
MPFQLERSNDFTSSSERQNVDVVCGFICKCNRFSAEQKLSSIYHIRRAKYFVSMEVREFRNIIRHIRKL